MPIIASANQSNFSILPPNMYTARCVAIYDLGTHENEYNGEIKKVRKVKFVWELPYEMQVFKKELGEQPTMKSKDYTLSLADSAKLKKDLESWRGVKFSQQELEGLDILSFIGQACQLNIIHQESKNGKTYAVIQNVVPLGKGSICPNQITTSEWFSIDDLSQEGKFANLPQYIQDSVGKSLEFQSLANPKDPVDNTINDVASDEAPDINIDVADLAPNIIEGTPF